MDHNVHNGNLSAIISFILGGITFLTGDNFEYLLKILVMLGSITTAIMAIVYYYHAIREKKKSLDVLNSNDKNK